MRNYKRSGVGAKPESQDEILYGFGFRIISAPLRLCASPFFTRRGAMSSSSSNVAGLEISRGDAETRSFFDCSFRQVGRCCGGRCGGGGKAGMRVGDPRHIPMRTPVVIAVAEAICHDSRVFGRGLA